MSYAAREEKQGETTAAVALVLLLKLNFYNIFLPKLLKDKHIHGRKDCSDLEFSDNN